MSHNVLLLMLTSYNISLYFEYVCKQSVWSSYIYVSKSAHTFFFLHLSWVKRYNTDKHKPQSHFCSCRHFLLYCACVCRFRNIIEQCLLENKYKLIVDFSLSSGKCWVDFDGTMCHAIRYWRCTFNYNRHTWNREMATILHMIQHATKQNVVQGYWWLCVYIRFGKF